MAQRQTLRVDDLRTKINKRLAIADLHEDAKREICNLLESVLMDANKYGGYSYIGGWQGTESYARRYN